MSATERLSKALRARPQRWLVTGAAVFIGSNLAEYLLLEGQNVTGMDNFATGHRRNLEDVRERVGEEAWKRFRFVEADIRDAKGCAEACRGCDVALHQAALGSVPRSVADPVTSNDVNVSGFINICLAARDAKITRLVYASSSSVYGDSPDLPKFEDKIGRSLSPYAASKLANESYAQAFCNVYGMQMIGLRYFNVFGPRQDPEGAYAAVIPKWIGQLLAGEKCQINGDGTTSRDFCYIRNVVQANVLAALADRPEAINRAYNVAVGEQLNLRELYALIARGLSELLGREMPAEPVFAEFRSGDVLHSLADIGAARSLLGYEPEFRAREGLAETLRWYVSQK